MAQIGVICKSTAINPADLAFIVEAWDRQAEEFAAKWNVPYTPVVLYSEPPEAAVASGEVRLMTIEDSIDGDPSVLGYHDDVLGVIFARILAGNNAESGSHEIPEEQGDPTCDVWKPMGDGREVAFEACDPVEGGSYLQDATIGEETRQIPVSNFVLPSWFDPAGQAPFDRMGKLTAPLTMDEDAYMIVRDAAGNTSDVFSEARVEHRSEKGRLAAEKKRARPDSRLSRRLAAKKPVKFRSEASSPVMPWGAGPRPEGYMDDFKRAPEPEEAPPPPHKNPPPQFG